MLPVPGRTESERIGTLLDSVISRSGRGGPPRRCLRKGCRRRGGLLHPVRNPFRPLETKPVQPPVLPGTGRPTSPDGWPSASIRSAMPKRESRMTGCRRVTMASCSTDYSSRRTIRTTSAGASKRWRTTVPFRRKKFRNASLVARQGPGKRYGVFGSAETGKRFATRTTSSFPAAEATVPTG